MVYVGSKRRIAKDILPIILKNIKPDQWYVEPFVGGANLIDKVPGKRLGADVNADLILLLKSIQDGRMPSQWITREKYNQLKSEKTPSALRGFAEFMYSFSAKGFAGAYIGEYKDNGFGSGRLTVERRIRNILKQNLDGIKFVYCSYDELEIPNNSVIYCDPPYRDTYSYGVKFDSEKFWEWCRNKKKEGHAIFVSEYNAPDDFKCIFEKEISALTCASSNSIKRTEKLFTV